VSNQINKGTNMIYRQGDVLIRKIAAAPKGERKIRKNGILAYGEVTGHCHKLETETAELWEHQKGIFLSVSDAGVRIVHDEHAPIVLPAGDYEICQQKEYAPNAIRSVLD
jgi:hypothetical protein